MSTPRKPAKKKAKAQPAPKKEQAPAVVTKKKPARKAVAKPVKAVEPKAAPLDIEQQTAVLEYTLRNSQRMTTALEVTAAALTVADANGNPMLPQLVYANYQTNQLLAGLIGQQYVPIAQYNTLADQYQKLHAAYTALTQQNQQPLPVQQTVYGGTI